MKLEASGYAHNPGISLFLIPETEVERTLLRVLWNHGRLEMCNGVCDQSGEGFQITSKPNEHT